MNRRAQNKKNRLRLKQDTQRRKDEYYFFDHHYAGGSGLQATQLSCSPCLSPIPSAVPVMNSLPHPSATFPAHESLISALRAHFLFNDSSHQNEKIFRNPDILPSLMGRQDVCQKGKLISHHAGSRPAAVEQRETFTRDECRHRLQSPSKGCGMQLFCSAGKSAPAGKVIIHSAFTCLTDNRKQQKYNV